MFRPAGRTITSSPGISNRNPPDDRGSRARDLLSPLAKLRPLPLLLMLVPNMTLRCICSGCAAGFPLKLNDPDATEPTTNHSLKSELIYC
jgi:hypothetical protein